MFLQVGRYETTAGRDAVWAVYTSVPAWSQWSTDIERAHLEGGPFEAGSWGTCKFSGVPEARFDVISVDAPVEYVLRTRLFYGLVKVTFDHKLTAITAGTQIMESADFSGPLAPLLGFFLRRRIRRQWPGAMRALTQLAGA
jgi:hypothetical protein